MKELVRIGCGAGFWGDSGEGPKQLVESGQIDYLILDYLAEITMSLLAKARATERGFPQFVFDIFSFRDVIQFISREIRKY